MSTLLLLSLLLADPKPAAYARPGLLIEPAALKDAAARKKFILLDARSRTDYEKGHLPGALQVDTAAWSKAFVAGEDRAAWARRIGGLGIDITTPVVVYAARATDSARIWWILRYWGIEDVRLLNGGWAGWIAAKGTPRTDVPTVKAATPRLKALPRRLATRDQLLAELKKGTTGQLIDTRSQAEHCGDKNLAKRAGAIPGSRHLEWSDTIDPKTRRFKSPAELARLFKEAGIDLDRPATTYCQSGGRAAVMAFAIELSSGKEARNYYRSWSEWGNDDRTPIVKPKKK
jgi:thiosulfate/3-mercaptopyruvate sulfurtransferase